MNTLRPASPGAKPESPVMPLEETAFLMNLIFQMRRKMGVIFPGD